MAFSSARRSYAHWHALITWPLEQSPSTLTQRRWKPSVGTPPAMLCFTLKASTVSRTDCRGTSRPFTRAGHAEGPSLTIACPHEWPHRLVTALRMVDEVVVVVTLLLLLLLLPLRSIGLLRSIGRKTHST